MPVKRLIFTLSALAFVTSTAAQCQLSDLFSGDGSDTSLEGLIVSAVLAGDRPEDTTATIVENRTLCLSVGDTIGTVSSISVLVNYTCSGSECPPSAVEQFDFGCTSGGQWTRLQAGTTAFARNSTPLADFETDGRRDCRICFVQGITPDGEYDDVTHCHCKSRLFLPLL